jgi:hypothetical protein
MYKAQYKKHNPFESWITIGTYNTEEAAVSAAVNYKRKGALLVRVTGKKGAVIYSS